MPRIAAAMGCLGLIVFSIGFNIVRYPAVRDMLVPLADLTQPDQSSQPAEVSGQASASSAEADAETTTSPQPIRAALPTGDPSAGYAYHGGPEAAVAPEDSYDYRQDDDYDEGYGYDEGNSYDEGYDTQYHEQYGAQYGAESPAEAKSPTDCASSVVPADIPGRSRSGKPLVSLIRPKAAGATAGLVEPVSQVRRLPPVDRSAPMAADPYARTWPGEPIPVYPTTPVE